ncbi:MAG TPA: thioredoxin-disulfide reductase [Candidatus Saccharimonadales bacterium]|nr:thioredoxin-disulfide reductase [Candidatus Saccharimonadales bacterium]
MYDVIILGSGPAGLTAAIYTTRASLKTLVIAGEKWGGQLMLTTEVENFPGFPEGIQGPDLMTNMRKQAEHHGAEIVDVNFSSGDFSQSPFKVQAGENSYEGKAIIIATGADTKWLGIPGEKEKIGRGVSSCAPCDAPFFKEKDVIVAGGGDSAMEEACVLTRFAKSVTIIHRRDELKASQIMIDKAKANPKIKFILNSQITEILGDFKVEGIKVKNNATGEESELKTDGVFVAIGHIPNSKVFQGIDVDEKGFIIVHEHTKTNKEGVFVAGDIHDKQYMQAVTAAGFGCASALEAERWLETRE